RFPNSTNWWYVVSGWNWAANCPGSHCGHVEHPRPEPVSRTAPPVTMMPIWATRFATSTGRVQRRSGASRSGRPVRSSVAGSSAGDGVLTVPRYPGGSPGPESCGCEMRRVVSGPAEEPARAPAERGRPAEQRDDRERRDRPVEQRAAHRLADRAGRQQERDLLERTGELARRDEHAAADREQHEHEVRDRE